MLPIFCIPASCIKMPCYEGGHQPFLLTLVLLHWHLSEETFKWADQKVHQDAMGSVPCVVSWRGIVQFMQQYGRDIRLIKIIWYRFRFRCILCVCLCSLTSHYFLTQMSGPVFPTNVWKAFFDSCWTWRYLCLRYGAPPYVEYLLPLASRGWACNVESERSRPIDPKHCICLRSYQPMTPAG